MRSFIATLLLCASGGLALGHDHGPGSWINNQKITDPVTGEWCCDLNDCREEPDNIREADGGYLIVSTGEIIDRKRVIWRSPGGWWRCRYLHGEKAEQTRCLIGPPAGS